MVPKEGLALDEGQARMAPSRRRARRREQPPQGKLHKILNPRDLYRAKSSEEPTTNCRGFAPLRAPLTNGFTVGTAIEPHPSRSTQFNQTI